MAKNMIRTVRVELDWSCFLSKIKKEGSVSNDASHLCVFKQNVLFVEPSLSLKKKKNGKLVVIFTNGVLNVTRGIMKRKTASRSDLRNIVLF